ncbi:PxKF domain-containing protein [Candidatus Blastococcus massiliensis]|uniref:PxKF domain-containing protein n=1 Tax=Candidatus Blastococcus massiliensis TaxID=1470358 RepID=UPI000590D4F8|nr:PxKF domain-containing protein [Candidatus Blastococcus massiliensis]
MLGALVAATALTVTAVDVVPAEPAAPAVQLATVQATAPASTPARTGPPASIAVLGDSISQGTGSDDGGASLNVQDGGIGSPRLRNSWATGDWSGLNSYLQRVRALPGGAGAQGINLSANGANMRNDFLAQARSVPAGTGLVLVQMGGNDLCRPSEAEMTSVADYRAQLRAGLQWLQENRPETLVTVYSVPDIYNLWYLRGAAHQGESFGVWPFNSTAAGPRPARGSQDNGTFWARQFWDGLFGSVIPCRSLLQDPSNPRNAGPTPQASHGSEARRLRVRQRAIDFNNVLKAECANVLRCRFDENAVFNMSANRPNGTTLTSNTSQWNFVDRDISTQDHFHPSFAGQQKLARYAFESGYDFRDRTAPTVTVTPTTPANGNGWHRANVSVSRSASDANGVRGFEHRVHAPDGSVGAWTRSISATLGTVTISSEGTSHVEVRALDGNGNLSASTIQPVRLDKTAPQAHAVTPAPGATFVQNEAVEASFSCSDAGGSDVDSCVGTVADGTVIDTSTVGTKTFTVTATDGAGNTTTVTREYTVVDVTPPTITLDSPGAGASFDRRQVVEADYACTDEPGGSGLATCAGTVPDGAPVPTGTIGDHEFRVDASDNAGNTDFLTRVYTVLDVTAPTVTVTGPENGAKYPHQAEVLADFVCEDDEGGSGIEDGYCKGSVGVGEQIDTSTLGTKTFTVTGTDRAGNTTTETVTYEVVDVTAPTVSSPHAAIEYKLGQPVDALFECTDEDGGSGVAECDGPLTLDTSSVGDKTFDVTTTDEAGNSRTVSFAYTVIYAYGEIRQPINADGSSVFKAGGTVPVKFGVTDFAGQPVTTARATLSTVRSYDIQALGSGQEAEQEATSPGSANTGNVFRLSDEQYVYNLSTKGMAAGSYQLFIRLDDGKQYTAVFTLR